jgi:hypothetical protein
MRTTILTFPALALALVACRAAAALLPRQVYACSLLAQGPICCDDTPPTTNNGTDRTQCRLSASFVVALRLSLRPALAVSQIKIGIGIGCSSSPQCCATFDVSDPIVR